MFVMRLLIATLATGALVGAATPAIGNENANSDDRMVCKRQKKTGTRFESKTCKTAAQWETMAEQNRRDAAEMVNRPQVEIRRD
jgi:hypothetical protein